MIKNRKNTTTVWFYDRFLSISRGPNWCLAATPGIMGEVTALIAAGVCPLRRSNPEIVNMSANIDPSELTKFEKAADRWWDPEGEFAPLHAINPLRTDYVAARARLDGTQVADIGCGGGLLAEALHRAGARVTAIDAGAGAIEAARQHADGAGLDIDYRCTTAEALAAERSAGFDVVTCMEMLEHVPDPASIVAACTQLVRPGGDIFFSTINRNPKAWLLAVVGAEYLLNLLPRGTHDYARFIRPSELSDWARDNGLRVRDISGMHYNPLSRRYTVGGNVDVNYLMHLDKPATT